MNSEIRRLGLDASFAAAGNEDQAVSVLCPICHDYMEDAKEVDCEGRHVFCGPCIKNVSDREKPCPFCRGRFSKMERPHALMRTLIEQIKWKCVNFEGGCSFTGTKKQLEKHLDDDCEIQEVKCPFIGCPKKMQRAPLEAHKNSCPYRLVACGHCDEQVCFNSKQTHNKSCPKFPVPCPNKCGKKVLREAVSDHLQKECAEELVDCRVSGCGESVKRKMMEQHEDGNMKKHVKLLHAEVEKMEIFQTEIDKLQSELDKQQEQTKTLHTELDKMKADVDTLKAQSQSRQLQSFSSSTRDILDVFVRLPDFETRSAGMQKGHGQYLESTSFLFQDTPFTVAVFPKGGTMADDGKASVYLRKKDAYDGLMTFTFQLSNGNVRRSEVKKDFSEVNVGDMWGFFNFCSPDDLLYAARATEGGVLELKVRLSAPKLNIASQVVNGYA